MRQFIMKKSKCKYNEHPPNPLMCDNCNDMFNFDLEGGICNGCSKGDVPPHTDHVHLCELCLEEHEFKISNFQI